jgi:glycosyltransferase involved in cell wall biosynthesis
MGGARVKVLVYPHDLDMGGSQLNAIELAARTRDLGHDVVVYGRPGALVGKIAELDLEFVEAPEPSIRPSPAVVRDLVRLVRTREIDVLHGYEWPPGLECYLAARVTSSVSVTTVMSMAVAPFLPRMSPLVVGTEQIAHSERGAGRSRVSVLEPPVDLASNAPGVGGTLTSPDWVPDDRPTVVVVSRLAPELKLEGILTADDAIELVNASVPARLLVVGDGSARAEVEARAARVNSAVGPGTVVLTGEILDPRPAYDLADVTIGMGGSALRALAFAKPLVVQGEEGYFRLLTPDSLPEFLWQGWYGRGSGPTSRAESPARRLAGLLIDLLGAVDTRTELGDFGRRLVEERFSLDAAGRTQVAIYEAALAAPRGGELRDAAASARRFLQVRGGRRWHRLRGRVAMDDFNARPVAGSAAGHPPVGSPIVRNSSSARADQL